MWTSPKRYIRTPDGKIVEFKPGLSGSLVVAAGSQLHETEARELGLLAPENRSGKSEIPGNAPESAKVEEPVKEKAPWLDDTGTERKDATPAAPSALPLGDEKEKGDPVSGLPKKISFGADKK